jgi:CheY-like chemotaxis protein
MVHVLIVDDDTATRNMLRVLLEEVGYHVTEADSGASALALMRAAATPLVVLLDHIMANVTGGDVLHAAAAEGLDTRHCCALMSASPLKLMPTSSFVTTVWTTTFSSSPSHSIVTGCLLSSRHALRPFR